MIPASIKKVDYRPVPKARDEIRAFLVVRNEALRLPSTLRHHRAIGVHRFFVLDNGSTDGTLDLLTNEPDVHIFRTAESYAASQCGITWTNALLDAFGDGRWTLTIDADEQFIYPHYEEQDAGLLCRFLDSVGAQGLVCLLLDMYSDRPVKDTVHGPAASLIDTCRYFDVGNYRIHPVETCPRFQIYGGVRERIFRDVDSQFHPPTISKVPLVRWRAGMRFIHSTHTLTPIAIPRMLAGLLHFKFLSDFHDRVVTEVRRSEHYAGAREYRAYLELLRDNGDVSFITKDSVRFQDSAQLVRLGLMRTDDAFERSAQLAMAAKAQPQTPPRHVSSA
jgi:glycosyltransferase involved in cell wall biosynthesis